MNNQLASLAVSISEDAFALIGIPTSTLSKPFVAYFGRKMAEARDELLEAMKRGEIDALEAKNQDESIAVIYRYFVAARDGSARKNLRLMARCICNLQTRDLLTADEFNRYAELLSRMTREQVLIAGRAARALSEVKQAMLKMAQEPAEAEKGEKELPNLAWKAVQDACRGLGFSNDELQSIFAELGGLGLMIVMSAWGSTAYIPSPKLEKVAELAEFESAA